MMDTATDVLMRRFLQDELDEAGAQALLEVLERSPELRDHLIRLYRVEILCRRRGEHERLTRSLTASLRASSGAGARHARVKHDIMQRLATDGGRGPAGGPAARPRRVVAFHRRPVFWLSAAAGLVVALGLYRAVLVPGRSLPYLTVTGLGAGGDAVAVSSSGRVRALAAGSQVRIGESVASGGTGRIALRYADEATTLELHGARAGFHAGEDGARRIELVSGRLQAMVAPQSRALVIQTPHATATVLGTVLALTVGETSTVLEVEEGRVALRCTTGGEVTVAGGYQVEAGGGRELVPQRIPPRSRKEWILAGSEILDADRWLLATGNMTLTGKRIPDRDMIRREARTPDGRPGPGIVVNSPVNGPLLFRFKAPQAVEASASGEYATCLFAPPPGVSHSRLVVEMEFYPLDAQPAPPAFNNRTFFSYRELVNRPSPILLGQWNQIRYEAHFTHQEERESIAAVSVWVNGELVRRYESDRHMRQFPIQLELAGGIRIRRLAADAVYGDDSPSPAVPDQHPGML